MTCSCWSRAWKGFLSQPAVLEDHDLICLEGPDPKGTGTALPRFQFKDFPDLGMNSLPCHWQWSWLLDIAVVEKCALLKWFKYFNYLKIFPFSLCSSAFLLHLWNIAFTFQFVHFYPKSSPWCSTTGTLCSEMLVFWLILHWQVDLHSDRTENDQHRIPALLPFPVPSKNKQLCLKTTPGEISSHEGSFVHSVSAGEGLYWCDRGSCHQHLTSCCVLCPLNRARRALLLWVHWKLPWILFCLLLLLGSEMLRSPHVLRVRTCFTPILALCSLGSCNNTSFEGFLLTQSILWFFHDFMEGEGQEFLSRGWMVW